MNKQEVKIFENLWKVKLLTDLKKRTRRTSYVTRSEIRSIERDLRMIRYGFEAGIKIKEEKRNGWKKKNSIKVLKGII